MAGIVRYLCNKVRIRFGSHDLSAKGVSDDLMAKADAVQRHFTPSNKRHHFVHPRLPHRDVPPRPGDDDSVGLNRLLNDGTVPIVEALVGMGGPQQDLLGLEMLDNFLNACTAKRFPLSQKVNHQQTHIPRWKEDTLNLSEKKTGMWRTYQDLNSGLTQKPNLKE